MSVTIESVLEKMLNSKSKVEIKIMDNDYILVFIKVPVSRYLVSQLKKLTRKTSRNRLIYGKVRVEMIDGYPYMVGINVVRELEDIAKTMLTSFNKIMSLTKNAKLMKSDEE